MPEPGLILLVPRGNLGAGRGNRQPPPCLLQLLSGESSLKSRGYRAPWHENGSSCCRARSLQSCDHYKKTTTKNTSQATSLQSIKQSLGSDDTLVKCAYLGGGAVLELLPGPGPGQR